MTSRRELLLNAGSSAALAIGLPKAAEAQPAMPMHHHEMHGHPKPERPKVPRLPAILCRTADTLGIDDAYAMLKGRADTLDAVLRIAQAQEDDPHDFTTGIAGLPNESGVVQLDACCHHGPTGRSAAVGAVTGLRNASRLARTVMETTGAPLLAGTDAQRFALAHGFAEEQLLTEQSRKMWAAWKRVQALPKPLGPSGYDPHWPGPDGGRPFLPASRRELEVLIRKHEAIAKQEGLEPQWTWVAAYDALFPVATPLHVAAIDAKRGMSCAATTSGLPWKVAGAISDVAMPGVGCYLDPAVGSAGASGSAEANVKVAGAYAIVQNMKRGMSPVDAGMDVLRSIAGCYRGDMEALRFVEIVYYVLRNDGAYAGVSLWHGDRTGHVRSFTIHDGVRRSEECAFLFDGSPVMGG